MLENIHFVKMLAQNYTFQQGLMQIKSQKHNLLLKNVILDKLKSKKFCLMKKTILDKIESQSNLCLIKKTIRLMNKDDSFDAKLRFLTKSTLKQISFWWTKTVLFMKKTIVDKIKSQKHICLMKENTILLMKKDYSWRNQISKNNI